MKRFALAIGILITLGAVAWGAFLRVGGTGGEMITAADKWLGTLSAEQKAKAVMSYDAPERVDWHFIPKATRKGLQVKEMNEQQRKAAHSLLQSALSQIGYGKATKIMELEKVLKELEKSKVGGNIRDNERYYFTIFGEPGDTSRWGLSVEGHHTSMNFVVDKGRVISSTPIMFGTNPAIMKEEVAGIAKGTRVLAAEEELAFELLHSLSAEQRKEAVIAEKALAEVREAGKPQPATDAAEGIAASKLNDAQKKLLRSLIDTYANNVPEEVAKERLAAIEKDGFDKVKFAWAGADKLGIGHYYRVQGDSFVIEFVNTQPDAAGNPANHIHCFWRDMRGDFALPIN
ncbi:hypothetical protein ETAA8_22410 [Anatilimnocola aggregata]|uniref:DUF3500 domain-containing protein n=1 Tax=Anatilimnocola aggregata TaxID=2528021 RepID=A0A517YA95_9BACT|nr:DUF3500 domain-containing protein [Anatilimnocola aggregata]QDU27156.1 hypothetical protein ETAA8_22410 [Anatilimnocola aggregata]